MAASLTVSPASLTSSNVTFGCRSAKFILPNDTWQAYVTHVAKYDAKMGGLVVQRERGGGCGVVSRLTGIRAY